MLFTSTIWYLPLLNILRSSSGITFSDNPNFSNSESDKAKSIPGIFLISLIIFVTSLVLTLLSNIIISGLTILNLSFNSLFALILSSVSGRVLSIL